jgi:hypothetical protein
LFGPAKWSSFIWPQRQGQLWSPLHAHFAVFSCYRLSLTLTIQVFCSQTLWTAAPTSTYRTPHVLQHAIQGSRARYWELRT